MTSYGIQRCILIAKYLKCSTGTPPSSVHSFFVGSLLIVLSFVILVYFVMSHPNGANWEGLGGPVYFDQSSAKNAYVDPTLDSCCQRDLEERRKGQALRTTLQRFDVVAERERRRRHAVVFQNPSCGENYSGCRCIYDPNADGGEYRALTELRATRESVSRDIAKDVTNYGVDDRKDFEENKHSARQNECSDEESDDEYDYLLDEDLPNESAEASEIRNFEEFRRAELEWELLKSEVALLHGFGAHRQIHPRRVLTVAGLNSTTSASVPPPPAVVLHFVDPESMASASLDLYLEQLSKRYRGTMFLRSSGRATLLLDATWAAKSLPMFRSSSQPDADLPALVAIRDGVAVNACLQLQGLLCSSGLSKRDGEIEEAAVFDWLDGCGVLRDRPPNMEFICRIRPEEEALLDSCLRSVKVEEERYDCGREGCYKTFPHEHVGELNERQDGLLVSKAEILGE